MNFKGCWMVVFGVLFSGLALGQDHKSLKKYEDERVTYSYFSDRSQLSNAENGSILFQGDSNASRQFIELTSRNPFSQWIIQLGLRLDSTRPHQQIQFSGLDAHFKTLNLSHDPLDITTIHLDQDSATHVEILSSGQRANCSRINTLAKGETLSFSGDPSLIQEVSVTAKNQVAQWAISFSKKIRIHYPIRDQNEPLDCEGQTLVLSRKIPSPSAASPIKDLTIQSNGGYLSGVQFFSHRFK